MAIIKKYKALVEEVINPLPDIYTITFSSQQKFKYLPGQFLHLALEEYDGIGQWPESRCFSMQSNPNNELIKITFSSKGNFTRRMTEVLKVGKKVWLKMPYGDIFQRKHDQDYCFFIAGGTGITPFLSLFTDNSFRGYNKPVLFAGFRNSEYNIFKTELEVAKNINDEFDINIILQNQSGILNIEKIYRINRAKTYFISGPPKMIKIFRGILLNKGVVNSKIITDDWE